MRQLYINILDGLQSFELMTKRTIIPEVITYSNSILYMSQNSKVSVSKVILKSGTPHWNQKAPTFRAMESN